MNIGDKAKTKKYKESKSIPTATLHLLDSIDCSCGYGMGWSDHQNENIQPLEI